MNHFETDLHHVFDLYRTVDESFAARSQRIPSSFDDYGFTMFFGGPADIFSKMWRERLAPEVADRLRAIGHARRPRGSRPRVLGVVYCIGPVDGHLPVKIGFTAKGLNSRRTELQIGCWEPLKLLWAFTADNITEQWVHRSLHADRVCGEWFRRDAVLAFLPHLFDGDIAEQLAVALRDLAA